MVALGRRSVTRVLGVPRAPRIVPAGAAWNLGVLLLTDDGVLRVGSVVRAAAQVRRGFTAESQRQRAADAAAARRGGFDEGVAVHLDWEPVDLTRIDAHTEPLAINHGVLVVRWSTSGGWVPLGEYLDQRIELLLHPPGGSD